jgi:hypothetical protein
MQTMNEELREFPHEEYKHRYLVSNLGKIWSKTSKIYLKTAPSGFFEIISVNIPGKNSKKEFKIEELVSEVFLGRCDLFLDHIDDNFMNNNVSNLRYIKFEEYLKNKYGNEWKEIVDCPKYYVSNKGEVWSYFTRKILNNQVCGGYNRVFIGKQIYVHTIVAKTFLENPNSYNIVNHKNGDKTDNSVENLEWCTFSENSLHSIHVLGNRDNSQSYETCDPPETGVKIPEFENYLVTEDGNVYSLKTHKYLKKRISLDGYYTVEANSKRCRVSRLVAFAYLPVPPTSNYKEVLHINGNKLDNHYTNLKWCTSSEIKIENIRNNPDMYNNQKKKVAKLDKSTSEVLETFESLQDAGKSTGFNKQNISKVCNGKVNSAYGFKWKFI